VHEVGHHYFVAMGIDIVRGRDFNAADTETSGRVVLLGARMAERLWPQADPLGRCLYIGRHETRCSQVIGLVEDSRNVEIDERETLQYYVPIAQKQIGARPNLFVVRVSGDDVATTSAARTALAGIDPRIRYAWLDPVQTLIDPQTRSWQLGATMLSVFGLLALLVAAIGLYSVLAFDVAQRMRELGLRAALGASTERLLRMVVGRAVLLTSLGVLLGVVVASLLVGRVESLLFEVPAHDPVTFAGVIIVLHAVAIAASSIPGWRAARVDPNTALRSD
jgi:hypothetical protein